MDTLEFLWGFMVLSILVIRKFYEALSKREWAIVDDWLKTPVTRSTERNAPIAITPTKPKLEMFLRTNDIDLMNDPGVLPILGFRINPFDIE